MDRVGSTNWGRFKSVIRDGHDTFNKGLITWLRSKGGVDRWKEDNDNETFEPIILEILLQPNNFRTWPITSTSQSGELDKQSTVILLNKRYLEELGYLDIGGKFNYDPAADRFNYRGQIYKAMGDTGISQAQDEELLFQIILKLEEKETGS